MSTKVLPIQWLYLWMVLLLSFNYIHVSTGITCEYCGKDFKSIGRHLWRCKSKIVLDDVGIIQNQPSIDIVHSLETPERSLANTDNVIVNTNDPPDIRQSEEDNETNKEEITCFCGKVCKGIRGLQAHKRACKIIDIPDIRALLEKPLQNNAIPSDDIEDIETDITVTDKLNRLNGVNLPTNDEDWKLANAYFAAYLPYNDPITDIDSSVKQLQDSIYTYFSENYGTVKNKNVSEFDHYKTKSNRQLKIILKQLKSSSHPNKKEIIYVSKLLRANMNNRDQANVDSAYDHQLNFKCDL